MTKILIFCYILLAVATVSAMDNHNVISTFNKIETRHIALGNDEGFGPDCPESAEQQNLSESRKNLFLREANVLRNFVAGGGNSTYNYTTACRMATIQWSDDLASEAAEDAKMCDGVFDYYNATDTFRKSGRAILQRPIPVTAEFYEHIDEHIDEHIISVFRELTDIIRKGRITDLVVDRNTRMGCGIASGLSKLKSETDGKLKDLMDFWISCAFETDIQEGESMYETCKSAGEKCKTERTSPYPNLCAVDEIYE